METRNETETGYLWTVTVYARPVYGDWAIACAGRWGRDYATRADACAAILADDSTRPTGDGYGPMLQLTQRRADWIAAATDGHGDGDRPATVAEVRASLATAEGYVPDADGSVGYVTPGDAVGAWIGSREYFRIVGEAEETRELVSQLRAAVAEVTE